MFIDHLYMFFSEMSVEIFSPLFNLAICWILGVLCVLWIQSFASYVFCKYFPPVCGFSLHFFNSFYFQSRSFCAFFFFNKHVHFFSLSWIVFLILYLKSHCKTHGHLEFLLFYVLEFHSFILHLIKSMIYFLN